MSTAQELEQAIGKDLYDVEGNKVGTVANLYASDLSGMPEWVTVKTGLFGTKESFVPLTGAHAEADGLHVGARKDLIKDAPRIDDQGHLSQEEAAELYRHYNLQAATPDRSQMAGRETAAGQNMAGQESMVRSEERLRAGTETVESGRVQLHKHVVTEEQQITVPVSHEEVRVVREPIAEGARNGKIAEEDREVVLHEERPVIAKETVPVERVGLETETVHEEQHLTDTIRKEQIEVDDTTAPKHKQTRAEPPTATPNGHRRPPPSSGPPSDAKDGLHSSWRAYPTLLNGATLPEELSPSQAPRRRQLSSCGRRRGCRWCFGRSWWSCKGRSWCSWLGCRRRL